MRRALPPALGESDRARRRSRLVRRGAVVCVALVLFAGLAYPLRNFVTDDTYIHLQYAKNFRDGRGLVFNAGEPVYGTTAPLWSLLLGGAGRAGFDLLVLAKTLSLLFGAGAVVAGSLALRRFLSAWVDEHGHGAGRAELAWALGTWAWATDVWLVRWSASGMETSLAAFLVVSGFAAYFGRRPWGNSVLRPACWWALAALVRPEAMLLIALLILRIVLASSQPRLKVRRLAWIALPVVAIHAPWLIYATSLYGTVMPATLAAKAAGGQGPGVFASILLREVARVAASRGVEMVIFVALLPLLVGRFWRRRAEHFLPLAWLVGLPLLYAIRGVPAITRYLVPVLPVLIAYAWGALAFVAARSRNQALQPAAGLVAVAVAAFGLNAFTYARYVVPQARVFSAGVENTLVGLGRWFAVHTPPGSEVAIADIGAFGYYADRHVVDLAGLITPEIGRLLARYPYDELVTGFHFESVARPHYLIDRAERPARMLFASPYAPCLEVLQVRRLDYRGIGHPEPAFYTVYRIRWDVFDALGGSERRAERDGELAPGKSWALRLSPPAPNPLCSLGARTPRVRDGGAPRG